ncbi:alcohol dehydrogenase [Prauserella coralliicola]|nr:alcohol dehydrogenase [Prauserella coralliicola]
MKTRAAVLTGYHQPFDVREVELDEPGPNEVLLKVSAAGLCHSDLHMMDGDNVVRFPIVGGHEAAGVVERVGPGVTRVAEGDHVVCSFIPSCGKCRYCSTGKQNLCNMGATILEGSMPDGTFRMHDPELGDIGAFCMLGAFSEYTTVSELSCVKVDDWLPLDKAVLVGCGVPTGYGSAVNAGEVKPGDTTVIYGIGGVGINAVQGAMQAGAKNVVCVDPVEFKRQTAKEFGATHVFATAEEAADAVRELTWGEGADQAICVVGVMTEKVIADAFAVIGKGSTVVVTGVANPANLTVHVSGSDLVFNQKTIKGTLFGSSNPQYDIVKMLRMYDAGRLKLDELITARYTLDDINDGYQDLRDGKILRGIIDYTK